MNMVELRTIDPMIALQEERDYLLARVQALEQILIDQSKFDLEREHVRFCAMAELKLSQQLACGWDDNRRAFRHGNLHRRWLGWLACAMSKEIKR